MQSDSNDFPPFHFRTQYVGWNCIRMLFAHAPPSTFRLANCKPIFLHGSEYLWSANPDIWVTFMM
jgi:hypothetical protein